MNSNLIGRVGIYRLKTPTQQSTNICVISKVMPNGKTSSNVVLFVVVLRGKS